MELFEIKLFVVIYRMGFAPTMGFSKYLIKHGYIKVNNKIIRYINYSLKKNDLITLTKEGQILLFNKFLMKNSNVLLRQYINKKYKNYNTNFIEFYNKIPLHLTVNFRIFSGILVTKPKINVEKNLFIYPIKYTTGQRRKNFSQLLYYFLKSYSYFRKTYF